MNPTDVVKIVAFVREACPAQKFSEYTPDIWTELLADLSFADARTAVVTLAKQVPFIGPPDIRAEVRRIRAERIRADYAEPDYDGDDVHGGLRAIREHRKAVGDGDVRTVERPELAARDVKTLIDDTLAALPRIPPPDDRGNVARIRNEWELAGHRDRRG